MRDYIYVDWERVRSYAAQLSGMPAAMDAAGAAPEGGGLEVLSGQAHGDGRLYRAATETRSLQAHVAAAVEAALGGRVLRVDAGFDFAQWTREHFRDGQFVLVTGLVRVLDYPWMASLMESLPKMMRVSQRAELNALKQRREAQQATQRDVDEMVKEHQKQLADMQNWKIDELSAVVRELYGDVVRVKIMPSRENNGAVFIASADPKGFFETPATLAQRYGHDVDARWMVLAQVNISQAAAAPAPAMPTGNAVEDMFERIALAVNNIHRVASAPMWPTVSVTPIAIYREVGV